MLPLETRQLGITFPYSVYKVSPTLTLPNKTTLWMPKSRNTSFGIVVLVKSENSGWFLLI
jgi:hypothetical protein